MPDDRHNAAFVVGAMLGGIAGAAVTLWKAPKSGAELRAGLSQGLNDLTGIDLSGTAGPDQHGRRSPLESPIPGRTTPERLSSRALEFAERVAAPLVGVKLGQTANDSGDGRKSPVEAPPVVPVGTADPEPPPAGLGHAATTDELTRPTETDPTPMSQQAAETGEPPPFPDLDRP